MKQQSSGNTSGLPGATDQPLFGALFGQRARSNSKSELVMLIKPTILRGESGWQNDAADVEQRLRSYAPVAANEPARGGALH